jgi:putative transposase
LYSQAGISRSGFYNYVNLETNIKSKKTQDLKTKENILKAFAKKGYK